MTNQKCLLIRKVLSASVFTHSSVCFNPGGKDCVKLGKDELNAMTKSQLELVGRDHGIELDKRKTKKALVEEVYEAL